MLIDPPFEEPGEGERIADALGAVLARGEAAAVWAPLKDLDGYDRLLGRIEAVGPWSAAAVQVRLRRPENPLLLNGCAMILVGGPDLLAQAEAAARAVAARCGEASPAVLSERFGRQP